MSKYQEPRSTRRENRTSVGRFRGGKLAPVMAVAVRGSEAGMLSQSLTLELDPIAGRMITEMRGEIVSVFVPVQAIDAIKDPAAAYAGMTEVIREKLLTGNPLFGLETEGEISKRCAVNPRSIGGVKKVNEAVRLAYCCAVNYLRQRKYVKAKLLLHSNTAIAPALISQTVLDRMNGVLDPEDRVNGLVQFDTGVITAPVHAGGTLALTNVFMGASAQAQNQDLTGANSGAASQFSAELRVKRTVGANSAANPVPGAVLPALNANLSGLNIGSVSLTDFYNAEKQDNLVRAMRTIVDENPEFGEEICLRWAHGLNVDTGKVPFIIAQKSAPFGRSIVPAMDSAGVSADTMRSDMALQLSFTVPVPKTELGGVIITMATLRPDETIVSQPHPFLSDVWGLDNFVADEMALDPVPVTIRDLDADCTAGQEATVSLYTGLNALKQTYISYGLNRHLDPNTVANKTAVWQLALPLSVTADTINYPDNLRHYPFADQNAEVCTYVVTSTEVLQSPMIVGPTPVEELAIIETEDLFEDQ